jgi:hypothetical protein
MIRRVHVSSDSSGRYFEAFVENWDFINNKNSTVQHEELNIQR